MTECAEESLEGPCEHVLANIDVLQTGEATPRRRDNSAQLIVKEIDGLNFRHGSGCTQLW